MWTTLYDRRRAARRLISIMRLYAWPPHEIISIAAPPGQEPVCVSWPLDNLTLLATIGASFICLTGRGIPVIETRLSVEAAATALIMWRENSKRSVWPYCRMPPCTATEQNCAVASEIDVEAWCAARRAPANDWIRALDGPFVPPA